MEEIIVKLRMASKAYRASLKSDRCPSKGEEGYEADMESYAGMEADQIGVVMCNLIGRI